MPRCLALCLALVLTPLAVSAQDAAPARAPSPRELAASRQLFDQGIELSQSERWGEALEYFRRARAIAERPSIVFNIGVALYRLGRVQEATQAFRDYLEQAPDTRAEQGRREEANRLIEEMRNSVARLRLTLAPPYADLRVDDREVDAEAQDGVVELTLDPGEHSIAVAAPGYITDRLVVSLLPGATVDQRITLEQEPVPMSVLAIVTDVAEARIHVDGRTIGNGSAEVELEPGSHRVRVFAEGYDAFVRDIEVEPGERLRVTATMQRVESSGLLSEPLFWIITGVVVTGSAITIGVLATSSDPLEDYRGTTGVVLQGLRFP